MTPNTAPTEALPPLPLQGFAYGDDGNPCALSIDQVFAYARAAIAADRTIRAGDAAADGWQPIETAPQTGRTLLLGYFNVLGKWRTLRGQWFTNAVIQEEWTNSDVHEAGWFETSVECDEEDSGCWPTDPTHWMPLPQAPGAVPQPTRVDKGAQS